MAHFEALFDAAKYEAHDPGYRPRLSHKAFEAALLINLYRDEPILQLPFRILTGLMDLDEGLTELALSPRPDGAEDDRSEDRHRRHVGHHYLRQAAEQSRVFSDLFTWPRSCSPARASRRCRPRSRGHGVPLRRDRRPPPDRRFQEHFSRSLDADPAGCTSPPTATTSGPTSPSMPTNRHGSTAGRPADKWDACSARSCPGAAPHRPAAGPARPDNVAFAPNTHELVLRILSSSDAPVRILTTDGEFHSFRRQLAGSRRRAGRRRAGPGRALRHVPLRFSAASHRRARPHVRQPGLLRLRLRRPRLAWPAATPTSSSTATTGSWPFPPIWRGGRPGFYVAGGYKYAMTAREPASPTARRAARPARRHRLVRRVRRAGGHGGQSARRLRRRRSRFLGATFDPSGLYRFNAVTGLARGTRRAVADIHRHVQGLQQQFLAGADDRLASTLIPDRS